MNNTEESVKTIKKSISSNRNYLSNIIYTLPYLSPLIKNLPTLLTEVWLSTSSHFLLLSQSSDRIDVLVYNLNGTVNSRHIEPAKYLILLYTEVFMLNQLYIEL